MSQDLTITRVKTDVAPKLRGTNVDRIPDFHGKCRQAAVNVISRLWSPETIRTSTIENAIYSDIYSYAINQDVRASKGVIDIRPISERSRSDVTEARYHREFDVKRDEDTFTIRTNNGLKTLELSKRIAPHATLHTLDSTTAGGTVTVTGDAQNLTTNSLHKIAGNNSLEFSLDGATGTGGIEIALSTARNLTDYKNLAAFFYWLSFSAVDRLTSVTLRWGSDSSNYHYATVTSPHNREAFVNNVFMHLKGDWRSAQTTGSPDAANIDYVAIIFNYTTGAAINNIRVDNITYSIGEVWELEYYSDAFFTSAASGAYITEPTDDSDWLNIPTEGYNIFLYELMTILIQELGQKAVTTNKRWFQEQLGGAGTISGLYTEFNNAYPCQAITPTQTYYNKFDRTNI